MGYHAHDEVSQTNAYAHVKVEHFYACTKPVNHFMAHTYAELVFYGSFYGWHMLNVLLLYI